MQRLRDVIDGAGLGLRRALIGPLQSRPDAAVDFLEIAPENWIGVGGRLGRQLRELTERHAFACHGLSLSLGGPAPLDQTLLVRIRRFLDAHGIKVYSEHLSWCADDGHLYDLLPIPFTEEAIGHVSERIRRAQDILGRRIAVENASYYAAPGARMGEIEFVTTILERADCDLLLDVNNVYVNSINHGYDADAFIAAMPAERVAYLHVAGHYEKAPDLLVDTHGADVCAEVWALLERTYARLGPLPTLVERDFNLPPLDELLGEVARVRSLQSRHDAPPRVDAVAHRA
ncbi:HvfB family MNIO-type RiPP peptide maturase [Dokdonella sp. MW10]|uniref:HvfB family MNIO-type RiPP peptide maturase n=1 Tax=Dokdonella sp. MW10 TaxID=2992926 RepID=UPI003F7FEFF3